MQETYDELDNIVRTLDNLIEEITNEDYIAQLQETKYQAEEELNKVREKLEEEQEQNERQDIYEYQRSVVYGI
jgi:ElaB/YqjD/DUF883 family membrane-anchored ribosome-binding protein